MALPGVKAEHARVEWAGKGEGEGSLSLHFAYSL